MFLSDFKTVVAQLSVRCKKGEDGVAFNMYFIL